MVYTVALEDRRRAGSASPSQDAAEVAVFFPDRVDWHDFRQGVSTCAERGIVKLVHEDNDEVTVETPAKHRLIRYSWNRVRGRSETRAEVRRLAGLKSAPIAYIGSGNTALTVELAEAVRDEASADPERAPVLLVPWATSVATASLGQNQRPLGLLDILPGRTFRFCPNNRKLADVLVRCLIERERPLLPTRVFTVVDEHDPYSADLARGFHDAIAAVAPQAQIVRQRDPLPFPGLVDAPGSQERHWAEEMWKTALDAGHDHATWVVLPLQAEPAKRLLQALRSAVRPTGGTNAANLRVLCGDAIGLDVLSDLVGPRTLTLWTFSPASTPSPGLPIDHDAQVPAEMVSALARCLDDSRGDLRAALAALDLPADHPAAIGRSLAFDKSGERAGDDVGLVLRLVPGRGEVLAYARRRSGDWGPPALVAPIPIEARQ
jgi:hypothetical protein